MISRFHKALALFILIFYLAVPFISAAEPRPMSPVDMTEINFLSSPRLSPDGRYMIYLRSETNVLRWAVMRR